MVVQVGTNGYFTDRSAECRKENTRATALFHDARKACQHDFVFFAAAVHAQEHTDFFGKACVVVSFHGGAVPLAHVDALLLVRGR